MGAIFQDTESILFGNHTPTQSKPQPKGRHFEPKHRPRKEKRKWTPPRTNEERIENDPPEPMGNPLSSLVESMKPTFFPPMNNEVLRYVILSSEERDDPMLLVRTPEVSLLFGTGFGRIERNGSLYTTFPDMRIVESEKERLGGWILTRTPEDLSIFLLILESLGFIPVYSTRTIIAKVREKLSDDPRLAKCRFFELFTETVRERRIRSLTLTPHSETLIAIASGGAELIDGIHSDEGLSLALPRNTFFLSRGEKGFTLREEKGEKSIEPGEVWLLNARHSERQDLKFTLDTFYMDKLSVGVVAGYTLKDRSELAQGGVVTFVLEEDHARRAILGHIYIDSRGFVHAHEMIRIHKEIIKGIRSIYEQAIRNTPSIERPELVSLFRKDVAKLAFLLTGRTPVVMPIVQEH